MNASMLADFVYYGLPCTKPVQKTMEKRILQWLRLKAQAPLWSRPFCYICLQRDATEKVVTCFIEVQCGTKIWSAVDYGRNSLHAFLKCLPQLKPRSTIFDPVPEPPEPGDEITEIGSVASLLHVPQPA